MMNEEALFFDPLRHREALAHLASDRLRRGAWVEAFQYADRLCRLSGNGARELLLRAEASRRGGHAAFAAVDLEQAWRSDPTDRLVVGQALGQGGRELQEEAARATLSDPFASRDLRDRALALLSPGKVGRADAADEIPPDVQAAEAPPTRSAAVTVIVPVYEDFEATCACFDALRAMGVADAQLVAIDDASPNPDLRAWLDRESAARGFTLIRNSANLGFAASVNKGVALCREGDVLLLNADAIPPPGFLDRLAAVAHSCADIGTVTPLSNNGEDTSFPKPFAANPLPSPAEIARLDALAWRANGACAIDMPNGIGFCLYITRACLDAVGPLPEIYARGYYEDVEFCLRAREKGFRNVCAAGIFVGHAGARSFRADKRRLVMRNLAALELRFPDHRLQSAAFQHADPLKAARAAIEALDSPQTSVTLSVRAAGAVVEREAEAGLLCVVDLGTGRLRLRGADAAAPQSLEFPSIAQLRAWLGTLDLASVEIHDPLSLPPALVKMLFALGAPVDLAAGDGADFLPPPPPREGPCERPADARACGACKAAADAGAARAADRLKRLRPLLARARALKPLDRMSEVFARENFPDLPVTPCAPVPVAPFARRAADGGGLAVLLPRPCARAEHLIVALGRALLRRGSGRLVAVFGAGIDDLALMGPGNVFVAGPVEAWEYERLLAQYEISALMSPFRTRFFGRLDALSSASALRKACFDWSFGKLALPAGDLALDPRLCDAKAADLVADWLDGPAGAAR